jgi:hypothetical protein
MTLAARNAIISVEFFSALHCFIHDKVIFSPCLLGSKKMTLSLMILKVSKV